MTSSAAQTPYTPNTDKVAQDNDYFRRYACLSAAPPYPIPGQLVWTSTLGASADDFVPKAIKAVGEFTTFDPGNDPDGYHDFGSVDVEGTTVWFKIDLYQTGSGMRYGAECPDDPMTTVRILNLMLPSDW